jgi:hypothetical protein
MGTDILEAIAIKLPCPACGERYAVTLKQVLISKQMLHEGCPVPNQYTNECPPLYYADLAECASIQEIERLWLKLQERVGEVGGELILSTIHEPAKPPRATTKRSKAKRR